MGVKLALAAVSGILSFIGSSAGNSVGRLIYDTTKVYVAGLRYKEGIPEEDV